MKFSLVIASILVAACCAASTDVLLQEQWKNWKKEHNKEYKTTEEELKRFDIWKSNTDFVANHNAEADSGKHTFWVKMNKFGDLTAAEFAKIYNGFNVSLWEKTRPRNARVFEFSSARDVPSSIDWRTQGYVTDIKDQGQCGSCWAFSSTGSLEGQHFKASGKLVSLSEQNLVDCSGKYGNQGCDGGLMDQAFAYIKDNKGIDTEDSYPYEAVDDTCRFDPNNVGATDMGFTDIKSKDEDALMQAVGTVGPVSVAIDASHTSFQLYSHGIYHEALCSQTALDHGVLSVGYGSQGTNKDFWIVKNSWGTGWGDKGYIMMSRNRNNNCGIATAASYPNV